MQLTEGRVSGETGNEAVSRQSLITHCAIINKEIVVDQAALCKCILKRLLADEERNKGSEKTKNRNMYKAKGKLCIMMSRHWFKQIIIWSMFAKKFKF